MNAHGDTELVLDTLDAIRTYVTQDIIVVVDGTAWHSWGKHVDLPAYKIQGFRHGAPRSPYRNVVLGMKEAAQWQKSDWYCYCEPDVLFTSSNFKVDLKFAEENNIWCVGNDYRFRDITFPLLESMLGLKFRCSRYLLGCCVFHSHKFVEKLLEIDFFERFLHLTNAFHSGFFPGFEAQGGYDIAEHIFPTLAHQFGGRVAQFANWVANNDHLPNRQYLPNERKPVAAEGGTWEGSFQKYPMRWRPEIEEFFPEAYIYHPLKEFNNPVREYYRQQRAAYNDEAASNPFIYI